MLDCCLTSGRDATSDKMLLCPAVLGFKLSIDGWHNFTVPICGGLNFSLDGWKPLRGCPVRANLVPRVFSAFKMPTRHFDRREDPGDEVASERSFALELLNYQFAIYYFQNRSLAMRTTETVACLSANLFPVKLFPCRKFHGMYLAETRSTVRGRIPTFASPFSLRFSGWKDDSSRKAIF